MIVLAAGAHSLARLMQSDREPLSAPRPDRLAPAPFRDKAGGEDLRTARS